MMVSHMIEDKRDDLDGTPATETVRFGWGTRIYEIDLSEPNAALFAELMQPWLENARDVTLHHQGVTKKRRAKSDRDKSAEIRGWAIAEGKITLGVGRLPANVVAEWEELYGDDWKARHRT